MFKLTIERKRTNVLELHPVEFIFRKNIIGQE